MYIYNSNQAWIQFRCKVNFIVRRFPFSHVNLCVLYQGSGSLPDEPFHIKEALARLVVEITKREWPQKWGSLLPDLNDICTMGVRHKLEFTLLILWWDTVKGKCQSLCYGSSELPKFLHIQRTQREFAKILLRIWNHDIGQNGPEWLVGQLYVPYQITISWLAFTFLTFRMCKQKWCWWFFCDLRKM